MVLPMLIVKGLVPIVCVRMVLVGMVPCMVPLIGAIVLAHVVVITIVYGVITTMLVKGLVPILGMVPIMVPFRWVTVLCPLFVPQ